MIDGHENTKMNTHYGMTDGDLVYELGVRTEGGKNSIIICWNSKREDEASIWNGLAGAATVYWTDP